MCTSGWSRCTRSMPSCTATRQTSVTVRAPASLTASIAAALELPVASIGSSTIASRSCMSAGSFTKYWTGWSVSSSRYMPMNPTRALEMSERTPSSIPTPARSTGQTATFLPEIRGDGDRLERRLDLDVFGRKLLRRLVGQQQRDLLDELAEVDGRRVLVAQVRQLVLDQRVRHMRDAAGCVAALTRRVRGVAAEPRIERPLRAERVDARAQPREVGAIGERVDHDRADLAEVVLVEAAHRRRRRAERTPEATVGGRSSNGTVFRLTVSFTSCSRSSASLPVQSGRAQVDLEQVRVGAAGEQVEPALDQRLGERVGVRAHLRLVVAEGLGRGDAEARRLRRDRVLERAALHAREDGAVDGLGELLLAEDEACARAGERLVRRRGDEVAVRHRVRMRPAATRPRSAPCRTSAARRPRRRSHGSGRPRWRAGRPSRRR